MNPYLFEYDGIQNETKYILVYEETPEKAFEKLNKLLNPTVNSTYLRLATIL